MRRRCCADCCVAVGVRRTDCFPLLLVKPYIGGIFKPAIFGGFDYTRWRLSTVQNPPYLAVSAPIKPAIFGGFGCIAAIVWCALVVAFFPAIRDGRGIVRVAAELRISVADSIVEDASAWQMDDDLATTGTTADVPGLACFGLPSLHTPHWNAQHGGQRDIG
ncbi:hypothetical protein C2U69_20490 [Cupriavidus pinatubonensis]|nr:hypothetical protein C2U69_20490 [Cupriavidus pinatubonensis]